LFIILTIGEAAMLVNSKSVQEMLIELRNEHIDIQQIIQEEVEQMLPSIIEEIIRSVYQIKAEGK
jgi:hypothetical protein